MKDQKVDIDNIVKQIQEESSKLNKIDIGEWESETNGNKSGKYVLSSSGNIDIVSLKEHLNENKDVKNKIIGDLEKATSQLNENIA